MENYSKNKVDWKTRLNDLDILPGEQTDLNASWEKLHARRKQIPERRKAVWYWVAAAFIVVLFPFAWLFGGKKIISNAIDLTQNTRMPELREMIGLLKNNVIILPDSPELKETISLKISPVKRNIDPVNAPIIDSLMKDDISPNAYAQTFLTTDTMPASVAAPAVKKKMAVVHLNEIMPDQNKNIMAEQSGRPYFPVKYHSREILSSNANDHSGGRDNIIRIKLSSQN